jgi:hypothetical protein
MIKSVAVAHERWHWQRRLTIDVCFLFETFLVVCRRPKQCLCDAGLVGLLEIPQVRTNNIQPRKHFQRRCI